jgi:hypothetical protein
VSRRALLQRTDELGVEFSHNELSHSLLISTISTSIKRLPVLQARRGSGLRRDGDHPRSCEGAHEGHPQGFETLSLDAKKPLPASSATASTDRPP